MRGPSSFRCHPGGHLATSDSWCSPPAIADPLAEFFGGPVDLDPCSNDRSIIQAVVTYYTGGLILPWRGTVYQNDPYSKATVWTDKAISEMACGNVTELVRLSMMSTSTHWWSDMCSRPVWNPRILALQRIAFLDPFAAEPGSRRLTCRFEPALTYFGTRTDQFTAAFAHLTRWTTWGRT